LEITGSESNVVYTKGRDYDVERFHGDPSRLRELLGHECDVDIRTGLERIAALFRTHLATEDGDVE
jgi:nucleoside-diphosphate-sugar epimerase